MPLQKRIIEIDAEVARLNHEILDRKERIQALESERTKLFSQMLAETGSPSRRRDTQHDNPKTLDA